MTSVSVARSAFSDWVVAMDRHPVVGAIIHGEASREEYMHFLARTYHYLRWSGPLLAATAEGLQRVGKYRWLSELVSAKAEEESPHQRWVLDDLAALGVELSSVVEAAPPAAVQAYVAWGFALAEEGSPAYLGAAHALEFISMSRASVAADRLRARRAIPDIDRAVSFLAGHADADADHVAELEVEMANIDDPTDEAMIALSGSIMCALYPRFFSRGLPRIAALGWERTAACDPRTV